MLYDGKGKRTTTIGTCCVQGEAVCKVLVVAVVVVVGIAVVVVAVVVVYVFPLSPPTTSAIPHTFPAHHPSAIPHTSTTHSPHVPHMTQHLPPQQDPPTVGVHWQVI